MNKVVHTAGWLALAGVVALGAADELKGPAAAARPPIVFTQLAAGAKWKGAAANPAASEAFTGARIALLSPAGAVKVLTAEFQSAADPNVSWDAKKILFAGRKTAANPWQIYEMNADGSGVRQMVDDARRQKERDGKGEDRHREW